jgi:hypothetical protein
MVRCQFWCIEHEYEKQIWMPDMRIHRLAGHENQFSNLHIQGTETKIPVENTMCSISFNLDYEMKTWKSNGNPKTFKALYLSFYQHVVSISGIIKFLVESHETNDELLRVVMLVRLYLRVCTEKMKGWMRPVDPSNHAWSILPTVLLSCVRSQLNFIFVLLTSGILWTFWC